MQQRLQYRMGDSSELVSVWKQMAQTPSLHGWCGEEHRRGYKVDVACNYAMRQRCSTEALGEQHTHL